LAHAPPGTKPYRCDHEGCSKSFNTNQHLHTHQKTHDSTLKTEYCFFQKKIKKSTSANRYTCVHPACISEPEGAPRYFTTWSSLQSHIRKDHPPTCTHSSCKGKTFSNQGNLRAHLKLHEQRGIEAEIEKKQGTDVEDDGDPPSKRRRGGEYGRDWTCNVGDCDKDFKSVCDFLSKKRKHDAYIMSTDKGITDPHQCQSSRSTRFCMPSQGLYEGFWLQTPVAAARCQSSSIRSRSRHIFS